MPDVGQRDRTPFTLEWSRNTSWPAPPLNLFFAHGYKEGLIDLRWEDPSAQVVNAGFHVVGVNVYRSFDSEFGPFQRITELPVGGTYWRDQTDNELVVDEDVTDRFTSKGASRAGQDGVRNIFRTLHAPIVSEGSQGVSAASPWEVRVYVDGVPARVLRVHGPTGEVEIDDFGRPDVGTQTIEEPVVPGSSSRVTCTYRYTRSLLRGDQFQRIIYRATTVALRPGCDPSCACPEDLVETPLSAAAATSTMEIEKLDYIWREAIRRNRWILDQGGERVKVFVRKHAGIPCPCIPDDYHKQPLNDCRLCFGTGFLGGYEGPYDVLIAPDDAERRIAQRANGRVKEHSYEVWTGPTPLLSMRDFLVKQNNERYSIGAVRMPSNRGNVLQQHFTIGVIATSDIRSKVPVGDPVRFVATQLRPSGPEANADASITEASEQHGIPVERELKGRTLAWENQNY
jgi:hypothetical protein